jgi:glycosyltransferase involved in cell wall biosynthesis
MSKIVVDARELRTSSGRYVERLLNYLQLIDDSNRYEVLLKPIDVDNWSTSNSNFQKVNCAIKEFTFPEQTALRKQIIRLKPDLVHFAFPQQPIWYRGKTITTVHDLTTLRFNNPAKNIFVYKVKQKIYGYVIKRAVRKSEKVITISQFVKDDLIKFSGVDPEKVVVTYESADAITEAAEPVIELGGKQFIMYVGRPTPHKNLERLIDAFVLLKSQHPDLILVLAGKKDANYKRIEAGIHKKGIRDVLFTDFIGEGQLRWLYEHCDAYVVPSLSEGFGLPGLEAMLHGAPVVSSNATCLPEIYEEAAHYFDPLDVQSMSDAINEVLADKNIRLRLIAAGKVQVKKYSWKRMAERTLSIYNGVLKSNLK